MSVRARINNLATELGIAPQHALQRYFTERFLARIAASPYANNFVIKGGTLMSAILGVAHRTTMDIDATIIGMKADEATIGRVVAEIAAVEVGDGIVFRVKPTGADAIRKDDDYGGYSVGLVASVGTIRLPIAIDVTFGDKITPRARKRKFTQILDRRSHITVLAYTVETVLAEKLQTVLSRGAANTRLRDFYDLHMLWERREFNAEILVKAIKNTFANRHSEEYWGNRLQIVESLRDSQLLAEQWQKYCRKTPFARDIAYVQVVESIKNLIAAAQAAPD
jgi:predicted nucleotidyltransferase component of viral defense system